MKKRNTWLVFGTMFLCLTFFGLISITHGAEAENEIKVETKEIIGKVGGIGRKFIAIIYKNENGEEYEQAFRIGDEVELKRIKDFKLIAPGDTVSVEYEESTQEHEEFQPDGSVEIKPRVISRMVTKITFMRPASDTLRSGK